MILTPSLQDVLLPTRVDEADQEEEDGVLPSSLSITRIDELLEQMRIYEVPKRAHFSINFEVHWLPAIYVSTHSLIATTHSSERGSSLA